jgi:hypothetical protein
MPAAAQEDSKLAASGDGGAIQVAGGNGEQVLSRDVYRLGTQFDFFRLLAW